MGDGEKRAWQAPKGARRGICELSLLALGSHHSVTSECASPVTQCGTEVAFSDEGDGDGMGCDGAKLMCKASLPFRFSFLLPFRLLIILSSSRLFLSKRLPYNIFQI